MNYDDWRDSERTRATMRELAQRLGGNLDAAVTEMIIENLLRAAWVDGAGLALDSLLGSSTYALATIGLQSPLYHSSPEFRDAVDDALATLRNAGWQP